MTFNTLCKLVAPVTANVPDKAELPATERLLDKVAAPVRANVPDKVVLLSTSNVLPK